MNQIDYNKIVFLEIIKGLQLPQSVQDNATESYNHYINFVKLDEPIVVASPSLSSI